MNDISKLPQWAQRRIERAEAEVAQMHRDVSMVVGGTPSAIEVDPFRTYRHADLPRMFLPGNYAVRFDIEGGWIEASIRDGRVRIIGEAGLPFAVLPNCSNVIELQFIKETI